jgi:hypothetical protein
MADMIDSKDAKKKLGCDEPTLQNYINSGTIRAQRANGKLLLNAEDVDKVASEQGGGDDEGTIVLTGDSDDLSIDLGKVVDDSAETMAHAKGGDAKQTDSITFGEELEVVSFDDNQHTSELVFDETRQTGQAGNLSFTDSNTAVMTAVDETAVGATTAPIEFQTGEGEAPVDRKGDSRSSRRSVRSQRAAIEEAPVHWIWPTLLIASFVIGLFFVSPYYVIGLYPATDAKLSNKDRALGVDAWTSMAGSVAGFSVEPNAERFKRTNGGEFTKTPDPQAAWRHQQFRGEHKERDERVESFIVTELVEDPATKKITGAKGMHGATYSVGEKTTTVAGAEQPISELQVQAYKSQ